MEELANFLWAITFLVGVVALLVLCDAMLPGLAGRARETALAMPVRSGLLGLLNLAFFGLLSAAFLAIKGVAAALGLLLGLAALSAGTVGLAVVARIAGERLRPAAPPDLRTFLAGAATLALAAAVPLVGWFVVLPLALCTGTGATIIALVRRRAVPVAAVPPMPVPVNIAEPPSWTWERPPQPPNSGGNTSGPL